MKKVVLLLVCGLVLMAAGSVLAQSDWAKYNKQPVPDDVNVPPFAIDDDGTLNCCYCHGPGVNHDGPKLPYCVDPE